MQINDLTFEIRDANLNRVAMLQPGDGLTSFSATARFNNVGSWSITMPAGEHADLLRAPGAGIVVTGPTGVLMSGPTVAATATKDAASPIGVWSIRGASDSILLGERLAYPTPATADVANQTSAYDSASGKASTVMYGYVRRNLVSGTAPSSRAVTGLTLATDAALGSTVSFSARFQTLGELLTSIANVSSPILGFDVAQNDDVLQFRVFAPTDKSGTIRMDTANGSLSKAQYGYGYGHTRAIVGGQGQLTQRQFLEVSTTASTAAETDWGRRVEVFVDYNNETDTTKLTQKGKDALADQGAITSIEVTPSSDMTMEYGVDWNLGDTVSVIIDNKQVSAIVSQATITVSEDGVRIGATVGQPTGFDFDSVMMKKQVDTRSDVNALQLKEAVVPSWGNLDNGLPNSNFGGVPSIDCGGVTL